MKKKVLLVLMAAMMAFSMIGCGENSEKENNASTSSNTSAEDASTASKSDNKFDLNNDLGICDYEIAGTISVATPSDIKEDSCWNPSQGCGYFLRNTDSELSTKGIACIWGNCFDKGEIDTANFSQQIEKTYTYLDGITMVYDNELKSVDSTDSYTSENNLEISKEIGTLNWATDEGDESFTLPYILEQYEYADGEYYTILVIDCTEDQSQTETAEELADAMTNALTFEPRE